MNASLPAPPGCTPARAVSPLPAAPVLASRLFPTFLLLLGPLAGQPSLAGCRVISAFPVTCHSSVHSPSSRTLQVSPFEWPPACSRTLNGTGGPAVGLLEALLPREPAWLPQNADMSRKRLATTGSASLPASWTHTPKGGVKRAVGVSGPLAGFFAPLAPLAVSPVEADVRAECTGEPEASRGAARPTCRSTGDG